MTFSNFIEGESNRLAKAMALLVSEKPGSSINPLYIYGARGIGKSHLLNAIANTHKQKGLKILSGSLYDGTNHVDLTSFLPHTILIDDFKTGVSFDADIFDYCFKKGIQVVMTGYKAPETMSESHFFNMGKAADIQLPEEELRVAILQARADLYGISLPRDAAIFIAKNIKGNVQTLIGALERVRAISSLSGQDISRFSAIQALRDYLWFEARENIG